MRIFIWVFVLAISFFSCKKEKPLVDNKVESVISDTIILGTGVVKAFNVDTESVKYSFPQNLKTNQVISRFNQMDTYSKLLESYLLQNRVDSIKSEKAILKTLESYNSLIIQLNETENSISEDFKKELEKAKFERDSLKQSEVAPLF